MSRPHTAPLKFTLVCALIALAGVGSAWWIHHSRLEKLRARLGEDARRSAVAFVAAGLARLAGTPNDAAKPDYAAIKGRLQRIRKLDARWRFVRLLRIDAGSGRMFVVAESAASGSKAEAGPGDEIIEPALAASVQTVIRPETPVIAGPRTDRSGTWMTGYARIGRTGGLAPAEATANYLGIGVDPADWNREIWPAALAGAAGVWVALGLPLVMWVAMRRQSGPSAVGRNLSEAMEQSRSAIVIVDLQDRIEYANRGSCKQIGYSRAELMQRRWQDLKVCEIRKGVLANLFATVKRGRPWEGEWTNRRKDGTTYPVRGGVTPVKRRDGSVACFVAVFDDMTEAKVREAALREARDDARVGDRAKSHFLATMSHEVRTPLNGIVGFSSLLLETSLTSEQREYVQTIRMSTEALIQLTGDILDFARFESGKLKLDTVATDPRECVEDALDLHAAKAADKGIELLHHFAADLPATVVTDGGRLRQVLINLIGNAVKFTASGEVEVGVRLLAPVPKDAGANANGDACCLEFTVRDTGIGIAKENLTKLFRPFSQVDESTTRRYGGTGLGLAICHNLVGLMEGTIDVTSEPDRGSTFRFSIRAPAAAPEPPRRSLAGVQVALAILSPALRRELVELVRSWQGTVVEIDALPQLSFATADVAVVEVNEETARAIAARPDPPANFPPTRLFGLVPVSLSNDLRSGLRAHFRLLVSKPVHHDAFFALLAGSWGSVPYLQPPTHFGFRVLVVEDNRVNQRLVQRVLHNLGCKATVVPNGRRAVDLLAQCPADFDLVLLDMAVPELDGIDALRAIRAGQAGLPAQTIWLVALIADFPEEQRSRSIADGFNDHLTKPLKLSEIEIAFRRFRAYRATVRR